jgi:hypothetical protein
MCTWKIKQAASEIHPRNTINTSSAQYIESISIKLVLSCLDRNRIALSMNTYSQLVAMS